MDEEALRRLATQLLDELVDEIPDAAQRQPLHDSLKDALTGQSGSASPALLAALRSTPIARAWVRRHTSLDDTDRMVGLGGANLGGGVVFACRKCGFSRTRESAGSTVLFCPNDGSILARPK